MQAGLQELTTFKVLETNNNDQFQPFFFVTDSLFCHIRYDVVDLKVNLENPCVKESEEDPEAKSDADDQAHSDEVSTTDHVGTTPQRSNFATLSCRYTEKVSVLLTRNEIHVHSNTNEGLKSVWY